MRNNKRQVKSAWYERDIIDTDYDGSNIRYKPDDIMYSIVSINGVLHFEEGLALRRCYCGKIEFPNEEVADLYAEYMDLKYDSFLRSYYSEDCDCYHLTSSDYY